MQGEGERVAGGCRAWSRHRVSAGACLLSPHLHSLESRENVQDPGSCADRHVKFSEWVE
jgi:hypothetical protein